MDCPGCGARNLDDARFCSSCGVDLARSGVESRKTVTVVFADVVGSTALGEQLDPEALRRVMGRYFERMRLVLERHGGVVEKFIGDAVMAVFGIPRLHEDDALRAVRAAAEMQEEVAILNDELGRELGVSLAVRIGVNTGEVVAGDARPRERLVMGDAVNVAARLEQAAAPGEVLIGKVTRELVEAAVELVRVEPLALKGKSEPVPAWRLRGVTAGAAGFTRRLDTLLVGRERELATLLAVVERAFEERVPHAVTIVGPAGIGKSRLASEIVAVTSTTMAARTLVGRCLSYGEGITYWPLAEIVRQVDVGDPEARRVLAHVTERTVVASADEVAWATRRLFERVAAEQPLLVVFDDVHWAEGTLLDLIEYVGTFTVEAPLVILCLARPELAESRPGWVTPRAGASTLVLEPLDAVAAGALVDAFGPALDPRTRNRVAAAAEGNPLFLEQLAALAEEGDAVGAEVPSTIQALLAARVDRLDPDEREVLQCAAIEGRVFHRGALSALVPSELSGPLSRHLMSLLRKEFIRPDRSMFGDDDGFRFAHILVRDAVYASTPKRLRADLHAGFARWLDRHTTVQLELEEIVGYHVEQAYRHRAELGVLDGRTSALRAEACSRLRHAGQRAYARSDVTAAINLLERAAMLAPDVARRAELLPLISLAVDFGGDPRRAAVLAEDAVRAAASTGDQRFIAQAATQQLAVQFHTVPGASADEFAASLLDATEVFAERGDEYGQALAWRRIGWVRQVGGRFADSLIALDRAREHARRALHEREEALATAMLSLSLLDGPTPVDEAIRRCDDLLAEARRHAFGGSGINSTIAQLRAMAGDFKGGRALIELGWETLGVTGDVHAAYQGVAISGKIELLDGDPAAAERCLRVGFERLSAIGDTTWTAQIAARLAEAVALQDRIDEALELTEFVGDTANTNDHGVQGSWRSTRARCLYRRGDHAAAVDIAKQGVDLLGRTDNLNAHADVLWALADVTSGVTADHAASEALRLYERKGNRASAAQLHEARTAQRLGA